MKGLKLQLKKIQGFEQQQNQLQDEFKNSQQGDNQGEDLNNISDISNSMIKSTRNRSSTMEIIEEVETRREQLLKKSIQNLTEREEDNDTDNDEDDFSEDTYQKYSNSAPEKGLRSKEKQQEGSEGESQDSCSENSSPVSARLDSPLKKATVQKKRMSIIDECLDQIRKRRDLIAAKLISNTYELDEDLLDSSDLSDLDQQKDESKFNLSQKFNSGNTNKTPREKDIQTNEQENKYQKEGNLQNIKTSEDSQSISNSLYSSNNNNTNNNNNTSNNNNNNNCSKLNENVPIISIEKLDSIINPIQGISPSSKNVSPRKAQQPIKQSQVGNLNNIKQSTVKQSQFLGMSRNFGGSKRFDLRKSSMYQNIGGLAQSRMINATSSNLKRSSVFCFEGFQDRQFARQLQKIQEDEDKSLVRQFEKFIEQIKKEKETYIQKIKQKRDNIKDFFKENTNQLKLQQQNGQDKDTSKKIKNNSFYKVFTKDNEDSDKPEFAQSINLQEIKNSKNESDLMNQYKINFQDYEDLNIYELLEKIEEEFLSKKQMDPQMSQFLRESMMMSTLGGQSFAFGENMDKTFFPLVVTEQDYQNFELKKQLDEMGEKIKHKNLLKLEQLLDKQKRDLKDLEIEYCKLQIDYKIFQQNEQIKEQIKKEHLQDKRKKKQIAKLVQSQILNQSLGQLDESSENSSDEDNNLLSNQSNSILNCTIAMSNQNFEERQKNVIEIFNELCAEYGFLKENLSKIKQNFNIKYQECLDKFTFLQNVNNNIDQVLEYNQSIFQFSQKSKTVVSKQQPQNEQDNEDQLAQLVNQIQNLELAIQNRKNESDIEFQFKKTKKINQLLSYKIKLEKLQYQRDFEGLLIDISENSETLFKEKQFLQDSLKNLKQKFEEMKEYNTIYKDQIISKQLNDIAQLKVEIENNNLVQRDLSQKYDQYNQVINNLFQQKNFNNTSQFLQNNLERVSYDLQQQKLFLVEEIRKAKLSNNKLENEINDLQFNQLSSVLIQQNIYLEQLKKSNHILI
ncbi:hypothetical protein TTHERM_00294520 (macronuclear) [Tetrahymena thermophila SB210]|uniref:Uncharacterized protein n=1 Tax=Tetrahymena thermophila (strain SB210) TaxID=312017 RepID=I7MDW3_TETTS|nr:hypothetical protein TTHERM_00294520 [Tetrahymena thermophila SB210]EAR92839.2 hypothetical protein TTHERM_00294520 [Tetrahymena thermophila SB210]|eukprot:XP_001013084.2 hypothetical protein TTHERM_00294520 [Tetrahymena thermophila SB210]